jgi:ribonuclease T2
MKKTHFGVWAVGWLLLVSASVGCPKSGQVPATPPPQTVVEDEAPSLGPGESGAFDYYVLSLSWSPQFCSTRKTKPDDEQCGGGKHFGFVVHGLWPQYEKGFPESCPTTQQLASTTVEKMVGILPTRKLIQHEWEKHGTCSGLLAAHYFAQIETAYSALVIPPELQKPTTEVQTTLTEIKQRFGAENPRLVPGSVTVQCSGAFVREVRICLRKDLSPMPCSGFVRDTCKAPVLQFRPVP